MKKTALAIPVFCTLILVAGCAHFRPVPAPDVEARGLWMSRFDYCEYSATHDQDSIKYYITSTIEQAADANFNFIIFQVRGNGDAYYNSNIEPWGHLLTGNFGEHPGWDPLQLALETAHANGIALHAWINTFPAWRGPGEPPVTEPLSPYLAHPEWIVCDSAGVPAPITEHYTSFSPGIPAVHDYIISVVLDIIENYDVDGIHFDYIRYPEGSTNRGYSHDSISVARYNSPEGNPLNLDWADWQRDQLTAFMAMAYDSITAVKPWIKVSAAVLGTYRGGTWNAYNTVYQDARRWTELGKVDFIAPMIYNPRSHPTAPFMERARDYKDDFTVDRPVYPGIGSFRYTSKKKPYTWREAEGQVNDLRREGFAGMVFFSSRSLHGNWDTMKDKYYYNRAEFPAMDWKSTAELFAPQNVVVNSGAGMLSVSWTDSLNTSQIAFYDIYLLRDEAAPVLLGSVSAGDNTRWEVEWERSNTGSIAVKARDRSGNESVFSAKLKLD